MNNREVAEAQALIDSVRKGTGELAPCEAVFPLEAQPLPAVPKATKFYLHDSGDDSVGMFARTWTITIQRTPDPEFTEDEIEGLRDALCPDGRVFSEKDWELECKAGWPDGYDDEGSAAYEESIQPRVLTAADIERIGGGGHACRADNTPLANTCGCYCGNHYNAKWEIIIAERRHSGIVCACIPKAESGSQPAQPATQSDAERNAMLGQDLSTLGRDMPQAALGVFREGTRPDPKDEHK
ncbi:MAG: hypothetical protein WAK20_06645 [Candidatus Acidiferrum sp.]